MLCATWMLLLPSTVWAGQCGYEKCWGGVGFDANGAVGWSYGKWSEEEAYNTVQKVCEWECTEVRTFFDSCAAVASGAQGSWSWAYELTREKAEERAIALCDETSYDCRIVVWSCSP